MENKNKSIITRQRLKKNLPSSASQVPVQKIITDTPEKNPKNIVEIEVKRNRRNSLVKIIREQDPDSADGVSTLLMDLRNKLAERDSEIDDLKEINQGLIEKLELANRSFLSLKTKFDTIKKECHELKLKGDVQTLERSVQTDTTKITNNHTQTSDIIDINGDNVEQKEKVKKTVTPDAPTSKFVRHSNAAPTNIRKPRLLVVGDSQARDGLKYLEDTRLFTTHRVMNFFKPSATFSSVVDNLYHFTKEYSQRDTVVIMAGTNNVLKGLRLDLPYLSKIIKAMNCGIVIVSIPYQRRKPVLNNLIFEYNIKLQEAAEQHANSTFVDVNALLEESDYKANNIHLSKRGKTKLFGYLSSFIASSPHEKNEYQLPASTITSSCEMQHHLRQHHRLYEMNSSYHQSVEVTNSLMDKDTTVQGKRPPSVLIQLYPPTNERSNMVVDPCNDFSTADTDSDISYLSVNDTVASSVFE